MARLINNISCVTVAEAAEKLATTGMRVLMMLRKKDLEGVQLDGDWYVASDSLACAKTHGTDQKTVKGCVSYCSSGGCGCK